MSGFSSEWLALREPVDHRARNEDVLGALKNLLATSNSITIADIACGTGSTIRALQPELDKNISWRLFDHDEHLLQEAAKLTKPGTADLIKVDLRNELDRVFKDECDVVTTSAFLDLVSANWLQSLVKELKEHNRPFYAALTYDGRAKIEPHQTGSQEILAAFNAHQRTDKGFGPALGPDAADEAIKQFKTAGFQVISGQSDWMAMPSEKAFQTMLLSGIRDATVEISPEKQNIADEWLTHCTNAISQGKSETMIGHIDFLAIPA